MRISKFGQNSCNEFCRINKINLKIFSLIDLLKKHTLFIKNTNMQIMFGIMVFYTPLSTLFTLFEEIFLFNKLEQIQSFEKNLESIKKL